MFLGWLTSEKKREKESTATLPIVPTQHTTA